MKTLLRNAREAKGLTIRELTKSSGIDQALISKFESGSRTPTKIQVNLLSELLEIDFKNLMTIWLKEKILQEIQNEPLGLDALKAAEAELLAHQTTEKPSDLQSLMGEFDLLKAKLDKAIKGE